MVYCFSNTHATPRHHGFGTGRISVRCVIKQEGNLAMDRTVTLATIALGMLGSATASAATRTFPVSAFDRIQSNTPFDVRVHTGTAPSVRASGPRDALDQLRVEVADGQLRIGARSRGWFSWNRPGKVLIDVTAPMLTAAMLNGPGDLTIDRIRTRSFSATINGPGDLAVGALEAEQADLTLNGPGDLTVAGRAGSARLSLHGPGDIRAAALTARDAIVTLSGPGDLALTATGTVQGTASGPGDVTITGGARCMIRKSGPGDVHCR